MTTVFCGSLYGRFIEIKTKFRKINFVRRIKTPIFLKAALEIEIMQEHQSRRNRREIESQHLTGDFFSRTVASDFTLKVQADFFQHKN